MDGMASVLFVVTIPTATEEERLQREFLAKKYDLLKVEHADSTPTTAANFPLKVDSSKTSATTMTPNNTLKTTARTGQYSNKSEGQVINGNAETTSTTTIDVPSSIAGSESSEMTGVLASSQYDTFPKRRKSNHKSNILEELSDIIKSQQMGATSSLKDVPINTNVSLKNNFKKDFN